jgi:hypothetical protein
MHVVVWFLDPVLDMLSQRFGIRPDYMPVPLFIDPVLDPFPLFSGGETGNSRRGVGAGSPAAKAGPTVAQP